ncbi:MAG TPA: wax ester/triacylglycerol synthase family O-acyltransferase [Solirubrobacteraceae bacterium]|nr:wax ester/triacylglycerol synthase family O-acyltransferase [Solirubrobacteraceae bacterium]
MADVLSALDETFLELEELEPGALMNIGAILVFDPPPEGGAPTLSVVRASRFESLGQLPRYVQRLSSTRTGRLARLCWEPAERFDIADHVYHAALPAPGGDRELFEWTGEFFSHPLDRTKPLWELVLIEGLEGGRWALASKLHHCLVDGVGSAGLMDVTMSRSPEAAPLVGAPWIAHNGEHSHHRVDPMVQAATAGAHAGSGVVHAALHPRDALARSRSLASLLVREGLSGAARTSLNVPIGQDRRFALVRVPLADLKEIGRRLGATVNDVALAACTSGLRRLLIAREEQLPARGLRAMVPVNVRDASDRSGSGNRVSSVFVELPVAEPQAAVRLDRIHEVTAQLAASQAATGPTALLDLAGLAPPVVVRAALARTAFSTRLFTITITNVPGPRETLYAFGAPLREIHPIVPLAAEHAVGIAIFSYDGLVTLGINADARSMHDLDVLVRGIEHGIDELRPPIKRPARPRPAAIAKTETAR